MMRSDLLSGLAARMAAIELGRPVRVAIDGVDAAGKTVLADELAPLVSAAGRPIIRASIDGFHNPAHVRRRRGALSPEGYYLDSFDYAALVAELLEPLGPGGSRMYRTAVFDFCSDSPVAAQPVYSPEDAVLIVDGVFLLRPQLRPYWDFSMFVRADFAVTLARAERRDLALFGDAGEVRAKYKGRYIPGQQMYLAEAKPESFATTVIDNNDPTQPNIVAPA